MRVLVTALALSVALAACGKKDETPTPTPSATDTPDAPALAADRGVDVDKKVIRVGALNDESGPAATIGKPFALGKRILAAQINAGDSDILPEGWTVELVERDHGYNPQRAVAAYNEIKNDVLFIATSFGTPNTLPLLPHLQRDKIVAFPASLSSKMAENAYTPPAGPAYALEARRAIDWIAAQAGDEKDDVKLGIVYQQDDYGADGLAGFKAQAQRHGLTAVVEETVTPGQKDFTAVISTLRERGATHVILTTLPSGTGPILGTAAQLGYTPVWIGLTPAWIDAFFSPEVIPSAVLGRFYWATSLPYWGEELPGMDAFMSAFDKHGADAPRDFYVLLSYLQFQGGLAAAAAAIERGDITREGYLAGLQSLDSWDAGGLLQPLSYTSVPYVTGTLVRLLKPDFEGRTWQVVAPYAEPQG